MSRQRCSQCPPASDTGPLALKAAPTSFLHINSSWVCQRGPFVPVLLSGLPRLCCVTPAALLPPPPHFASPPAPPVNTTSPTHPPLTFSCILFTALHEGPNPVTRHPSPLLTPDCPLPQQRLCFCCPADFIPSTEPQRPLCIK